MSESVIADDLHIKGELTTTGDVELKGTVEGEISCRTLVVSEAARVEGSAAADRVVVRGTVDGKISGNRVMLTSSARVTGELVCKTLSIDEEAYFDGRSQRVEDPLKDTRRDDKSGSGSDDTSGSDGKNGSGRTEKDESAKEPPLAARPHA